MHAICKRKNAKIVFNVCFLFKKKDQKVCGWYINNLKS